MIHSFRRNLETRVWFEKRGVDGKDTITSPARRDVYREDRGEENELDHRGDRNAGNSMLSAVLTSLFIGA